MSFILIIGFVTDGEWNSLRTRGGHRAVSIIQIAMDARKLAQSTKVVDLDKFFKPTDSNGVLFFYFINSCVIADFGYYCTQYHILNEVKLERTL